MKPVALKRYFNERNDELVKCIKKFDARNSESSIHDLRVEIKKIHFVILYSLRPDKKHGEEKLYKTYKKIFKKAGAVRDVQMKQELIKKYFQKNSVSEIEDELKSKEKKYIRKFDSSADRYIKTTEKAKKNVLDEISNLQPPPALSYADDIIKRITLRFANLKKETLHESRKELKNVVYSEKMLPHIKDYLSRRINLAVCENLQRLIGSWHDKIVLLEWIREKGITKRSTGIKKLESAINYDYTQIKKSVITLFKQPVKTS